MKKIFAIFISAFPAFSYAKILPNCVPNCGWQDMVEFANNALNFLIFISTVVAGALVIYAGILFAVYANNPDRRKKGKEVLKHTLIGLLIVLFAWFVVDQMLKILTDKGVEEWSDPANISF